MSALDTTTFDPGAHAFAVDRLNAVLEAVGADERTTALIEAQNVNPVNRLRYNDHGPKHISVVLERAIALYDLLVRGEVSFNGARDHGLDGGDEPVIIALGAIYHDVGQVVHRDRHSYYSVQMARDRIREALETAYDVPTATKLTGEVLHAIVCHHVEESPLTREAGVVRVADALDMERGRSRRPYEAGGRGINTVSSRAIRSVNLRAGDGSPVAIEIEMTSAAGIYQVDELLKSKIRDSRLSEFIEVVAIRVDEDDRLLDRFEL